MSDEQKTEEKKEEPNEEKQGVEAAPLKGLLGVKIGMTRVFVDDTTQVPVTVISADGNIVSQVKTTETDGYNAVQVAYGDTIDRKLVKAAKGHLAKNGLPLKKRLFEFRVNEPAAFKIGQPVSVRSFQAGEWVKVSSASKGKGFAGTIKRFGFGGGPHSHGHGEYRRSPGSSGGQGPQHVLPGTRKPGHKGAVWATEPHVEVVGVDEERNLILIRGSVPGANGNFVVIRPSEKKMSAHAAAKKGKK